MSVFSVRDSPYRIAWNRLDSLDEGWTESGWWLDGGVKPVKLKRLQFPHERGGQCMLREEEVIILSARSIIQRRKRQRNNEVMK